MARFDPSHPFGVILRDFQSRRILRVAAQKQAEAKSAACKLLRKLSMTLIGGERTHYSRIGYRTSARMRTGAVEPPATFAGATMATAPLAGMRSRLATLVSR